MKITLFTLAFTGLLSSGAALAYEDSMQRESHVEAINKQVAAATRSATWEATAPGAPAANRVADVATTTQPDPNLMPYVNGGWYGQ